MQPPMLQSQECIQEICNCPTLPDNAIFEVSRFVDTQSWGEVCLEVPCSCPKHMADEEAELQDYMYQ
jgi:hypothetical protein